MPRSHELIALDDLRRLGRLAALDREDLFRRKSGVGETGDLYSHRLFAVALCQGAAVHFLNGILGKAQEPPGIKDLDVWSFYRANPDGPFPYRRVAKVDFGDPKFGTTDDSPDFIGRRVDLIGRSVTGIDFNDPVEVIRNYLQERRTRTATLLAEKAVVLIEPDNLLGTVVWR